MKNPIVFGVRTPQGNLWLTGMSLQSPPIFTIGTIENESDNLCRFIRGSERLCVQGSERGLLSDDQNDNVFGDLGYAGNGKPNTAT